MSVFVGGCGRNVIGRYTYTWMCGFGVPLIFHSLIVAAMKAISSCVHLTNREMAFP